MGTCFKQRGRVDMAEVVEAKVGHTGRNGSFAKAVGNSTGVEGLAIVMAEHEVIVPQFPPQYYPLHYSSAPSCRKS